MQVLHLAAGVSKSYKNLLSAPDGLSVLSPFHLSVSHAPPLHAAANGHHRQTCTAIGGRMRVRGLGCNTSALHPECYGLILTDSNKKGEEDVGRSQCGEGERIQERNVHKEVCRGESLWLCSRAERKQSITLHLHNWAGYLSCMQLAPSSDDCKQPECYLLTLFVIQRSKSA